MKKNNKKNQQYVVIAVLVLVLSMVWSSYVWSHITGDTEEDKIENVSLNEFNKLVKEKKVDRVQYNSGNEYMTVCLFNDETKEMTLDERQEYKYTENKDKRKVPYTASETFREDLLSQDVILEVVASDSAWKSGLSSLVSLLLPLALFYIIFYSMSNRIGGNVDEKTLVQKSDVKFSDVLGHDEVLDDIKFITEFIKSPEIGKSVGAKTPKGILLAGAPGTGKTLIAKAIAGEANVPFIYVNSSSLIELYVGVGAKRVRKIFDVAKKNAPCIVFVDEIDSIGTKRESGQNSEREQTINELLQQMDGFKDRDGIFIVAATNRPDCLDKALIRSGRFDRRIDINPPKNWKVRRDLFKHYLDKVKVDESIDLDSISKQTVGFTGSDIATICNEAGLIAVMHKKETVDRDCIEEAIDKKIFNGNRSKRTSYIKDKEIVAYHEAGHAVMSYLLNEKIARASIIASTSGVGGFVMHEEHDSVFTTDKMMENRIKIAYAGRASEEVKFDAVTQGASSDISQATNLIIDYIEHYGFDKDFGILDMGTVDDKSLIGDSFGTSERELEMSKKLYADTVNIIRTNYNLVEKLASTLMSVETMSGTEIKELLDGIAS